MVTTLSFYISLAETAEDKSLIERLYNGYERYMYAVAFSVLHNEQDAEDTVHEAFLRIIKISASMIFPSMLIQRHFSA